jgi:hypothetical protein
MSLNDQVTMRIVGGFKILNIQVKGD